MPEKVFGPEMLEIREKQLMRALSACTGAYYDFNVTQNRILGTPVQIIDGVEYSIHEAIGLPEHCEYTAVIEYWGSRLVPKEQKAFFDFFSREHLLKCYAEGERHIAHSYWTKDVLGNSMLAEQNILLYEDITNGDILAITYVKDLTTIDELKQKEAENRRRLEKAIQIERESKRHALEEERRNNQYRKAIISGAISVHEINLTRDYLENLFLVEDGEEKRQKLFMGIKIPCRYSDFVRECSEQMPADKSEQFVKNNNAEYLLECFEQGKLEMQVEFDVGQRNGKCRHMRKTYLLTRDPITEDIFALIVSKDITEETERKCIQERQLQSQMEIIQALGSEYSSIYLVDLKNERLRVISSNGKFQAIKNFTDGVENYHDVLAIYVKVAVYPEDREDFFEAIQPHRVMEALQNDEVYDINYRRIADGVMDYAQLKFLKVESGNTSRTVCAFRSVDEIVKKEIEQREALAEALKRAQEAEKAKTTFLFNMSHDIRTPMNAIIGFNSLAQKHIDDREKALDALRKAELSSNHMLNLINDVLEMARIESGKMELNEQVVDVFELIAETDGMFRNEMEEKGITFVVDNRCKERYVVTDGMRITQVVANLLSNAMKFTKAGGTVTFQVTETAKTEDDCVQYEVHVRDTGIGMSKEFQKHLFNAFERENSATVSRVSGTGLGLAISKNLAIMLGGSIVCESELGKGTDFTFTFQTKVAAEHCEKAHGSVLSTDENTDFTGRRILLVEDNELNREIATEILKEYGFEIETADDGSVAVDMVKHSDVGYYDLVLMDIQMPYMDGYTATREIRLLQDRELARIPIIAMTANAFDEDRRKALEVGMNGHIAKPLDVNKLLAVLRKTLN